jgi:hypothetical protein
MSSINAFEIKNGQLLRYKGSETDVVIPDGVTSIGYGAFQWRTRLTSVIIPESVTNICDVAFKDCSGLTSVTISNGVTSIGDEAFLRCKSLTNIAIPDSVTKIGYNSFADCDNLNFNIWKNGKYLGNEENLYHALVSYTTDDNKTLFVHANTKVMIDLEDGMYIYYHFDLTGEAWNTMWHEGANLGVSSKNLLELNDWNEDGKLDYEDYKIAKVLHSLEDLNGDGLVDYADYLLSIGEGETDEELGGEMGEEFIY